MTELQEIKALLREQLRLNFVQHQDLIWALCPNVPGIWLRRFVLGYRMQKKFKLFTDEEWNLAQKNDFPNVFKRWPEMTEVWKQVRKYYPKDSRKFIDGIIAVLAKEKNKEKIKRK